MLAATTKFSKFFVMLRKTIDVYDCKIVSSKYLASIVYEYNYTILSVDGYHLHAQLYDHLSQCSPAMKFVISYQDKDVPVWFKSMLLSSTRLIKCLYKTCGNFMIPFVIIAVRSSLSTNTSCLTFEPVVHYTVTLDSQLTNLFLPMTLYNNLLMPKLLSFAD